MSHYAQIDKNNIVVKVIVADEDFIQSGALGDPKEWIQTSYNTSEGRHPSGIPIRKNYAGIGFKYDPVHDAFIPPKPDDNYILDEQTFSWKEII